MEIVDEVKETDNKLFSLDEIKNKILPVAEQYGLKKVYLFGSYARGNATNNSDIDICIEEGKQLTLFDLSGLYLDLEENMQSKIDLVTAGGLKGSFRENIDKEKVCVYG